MSFVVHVAESLLVDVHVVVEDVAKIKHELHIPISVLGLSSSSKNKGPG